MKMRSGITLGAAGLLFGVSTSVLAQGNAAAGMHKNALCQGCHGIPDYKTAFPFVYRVPKLAGQHAAYIVSALKAYKAGDRSHPTMRAIAAGLSDQDMADLAAYYAAPDGKTTSQ